MTKIKLAMSDIDGTILTPDLAIDPGMADIVKELRQQDIPLVLNSARSPQGMANILEKIDNRDNPIACFNGALILPNLDADFADAIYSLSLDIKEAKQLISILKSKFSTVSINLYSGQEWFVEAIDSGVEQEIKRTGIQPTVEDFSSLFKQADFAIHKLLLIGDSDQLTAVQAYFNQDPLDHTLLYRSKANYIEVTNQEVSKGQALVEVSKYYGIPLAECFAVGDNYNDIPMVEAAGIGIAMGNAPKELKTIADGQTASNEEEGASKAIRRYVIEGG